MKNKKIKIILLSCCVVFLFFNLLALPAFALDKEDSKEMTEDLTTLKPKINLPIPTLPSLSNATINKKGGEIQSVTVPWIAEYIIGFYKYALTIGAILAIIMIIAGGFLHMMAGARPELATKAKQMIFGSLNGLVIILFAYLILFLINPNLVSLKAIKLDVIKKAILIMDSQDAPSKMTKGHIKCNIDNQPVKQSDGSLVDQSKLTGNGKYPFYETNSIYTRSGKYQKPDLIIIHATNGTSFLNKVAEKGGPTVHYLIDRNGDIAQLIREENVAWSTKTADAAKRSISWETVNLGATCGASRFQTAKKDYRYSGASTSINKIKHPRCLTVETMSPLINIQQCAGCETEICKKTAGYVCDGCAFGTTWEVYPQTQLNAMVELAAWVAKRHNIPIKHPVTNSPTGTNCPSWNAFKYCWDGGPGIVGHGDIQGETHGDPGPAFDWDKFISAVQAKASGLNVAPLENYSIQNFETMMFGMPLPNADAEGCCKLLNGFESGGITEGECDTQAVGEGTIVESWAQGACS